MNEIIAETASAPAERHSVASPVHPAATAPGSITLWEAICWGCAAIGCFHLAYALPILSALMVGYLFGLAQLTRIRTTRQAAWLGFAVGLLTVGPQLTCFWTLFGVGAAALWSVLGFWIGLFVVLGRFSIRHFGNVRGFMLLPFLWTGLEYLRSELYPLKFSWLNVGYSLSGTVFQPILHFTGMYGAGFITIAIAVALLRRSRIALLAGVGLTFAGLIAFLCFGKMDKRAGRLVPVAGVQLEFPAEAEVITALDQLVVHHPEAQLLMLSEYTFIDGSVPDKVRNWCREHERYVLLGAKDPAPDSNFYDTAFVVGPAGDIVFKQAKCVPVQFMKDGLPAKEQALWDSPWGKIGICICYDLSYTRVTDRLVKLGAQALLVPTMDVIGWGRHEHELHARVAPVRASEYGLPIFRVASSGISQFVSRSGHAVATAGFPGDRAEIFGVLQFAKSGVVPWDRWLARGCLGVTAVLILWFIIRRKEAH